MMKKYELFFKALSDRTRLRIVSLLLKSGESLCVCEIVDSIGEPQYKVSKHLKELKSAGLVDEEKVGRWVNYGLTTSPDPFRKKLFETIASIPEEILNKDEQRLGARVSLRQKGKCVVGLKSPEWKKLEKKLGSGGAKYSNIQ